MMFLFNRVFWALILIFLGSALIAQNIWGIDLKIWAIFWPLMIIMLGVAILRGNEELAENKTLFASRQVTADRTTDRFTTIFGQTELDLTHENFPDKLRVSNLFGVTIILLAKKRNLAISAESFFGQIIFPDNSDVTFGNKVYSSTKKSGQPLEVKASNAFGQIRFEFNANEED